MEKIDFDYIKLKTLSSKQDLEEFLKNWDIKFLTSDHCRAIGLRCNRLKLPEDAIFWFSQSLLKNENLFVFFYRGMAHQKLGLLEEAIQDYEHTILQDPNHETRPFVLLHLAHCYFELGVMDKARNMILSLKENFSDIATGEFNDFSVYCRGHISAKSLFIKLVL